MSRKAAVVFGGHLSARSRLTGTIRPSVQLPTLCLNLKMTIQIENSEQKINTNQKKQHIKKTVLICIISLISLFSNGQYSMTTTLVAYHPLTSPMSLNNGTIWNEGSNFPIYFNFNFKISGQTYTALNVMAGGGINFPGLGTKELFVYHVPYGGYMLRDKGISNSESSINYEISGSAGQHLLKIEWINAGFVQWFSSSDSTDYVDFQIWLFEVDNHIEIHFGNNQAEAGTYGYPEATSDSNPGPGIIFWFDDCSNMFGVTGPCNLPSYWFFNSCGPNFTFIDGTPSSGITYNILPTSNTSITEFSSDQIKLYPNPLSEQTTLYFSEKHKNSYIIITDLLGKIIKTLQFSGTQLTIKKGDMKKGLYLIQIINEKGDVINKKIIVE
jgi:hypothetical protein